MEGKALVMTALFDATVDNLCGEYNKVRYDQFLVENPNKAREVHAVHESLCKVWNKVLKQESNLLQFKKVLSEWYAAQMEIIIKSKQEDKNE